MLCYKSTCNSILTLTTCKQCKHNNVIFIYFISTKKELNVKIYIKFFNYNLFYSLFISGCSVFVISLCSIFPKATSLLSSLLLIRLLSISFNISFDNFDISA